MRAEWLCCDGFARFCAARDCEGAPVKIRRRSNAIWVGPEPMDRTEKGFILSNDILERAERPLIVSAKCACYIQLKAQACG